MELAEVAKGIIDHFDFEGLPRGTFFDDANRRWFDWTIDPGIAFDRAKVVEIAAIPFVFKMIPAMIYRAGALVAHRQRAIVRLRFDAEKRVCDLN